MSVEERIRKILFNGPNWLDGKELRYIAMDVRKLEDRVKQLEEAGDVLSNYLREMPYASDYLAQIDERILRISNWNKAKEDKL